jgi:hypothetical protein
LEPKLQGFRHNDKKPWDKMREEPPCFNAKSMTWVLLRVKNLQTPRGARLVDPLSVLPHRATTHLNESDLTKVS